MENRYEEIVTKGKKHREPRVGAVFGGLTVLGRSGKRRNSIALFNARCLCGAVVEIPAASLERNKNGCQGCRTKKGFVDAVFNGDKKLYKSFGNRYRGIMARVYDPRHHQYKDYGGRGVLVHEAWVKDQQAFMRYVATLEGFSDTVKRGLQIDRIDNDKGYEPGNLRLIPAADNSKNRRTTIFLEHEGVRYTAKEFRARFCPAIPKNRFYQMARTACSAEKLLERCAAYKPRKLKRSERELKPSLRPCRLQSHGHRGRSTAFPRMSRSHRVRSSRWLTAG